MRDRACLIQHQCKMWKAASSDVANPTETIQEQPCTVAATQIISCTMTIAEMFRAND